MDPRTLNPAQWDQVARAMTSLYLFVGLALNAAFAFLLGHAIIPSLTTTRTVPGSLLAFRRLLDPVFVLSLVFALVALARALYLAVDLIRAIYPRFAI